MCVTARLYAKPQFAILYPNLTFTENQDSQRHLLDLFWHVQRLRIKKSFLFSKWNAETFSICLKLNFIKLYKISSHSAQLILTIVVFNFSIGCLIELKICEVSRNSFLNKCSKFQLSILKNKKSFIPKKYFLSRCQYQNRKALFTDPIFSEGFEPNLLMPQVYGRLTSFFFLAKKILAEKDLRKVLFKH